MKLLIKITLLVLVIAAGATMAYRYARPGWVRFREAEDAFAAKRYEDAADLYQEAVRRGAVAPGTYARLVEAQLLSGRSRDAEETARLFMDDRKPAPAECYDLAERFVAHGEFPVAIQLLNHAIARDPADRRARFRMAQALTWVQRFDEAIEQYRTLLGGKL